MRQPRIQSQSPFIYLQLGFVHWISRSPERVELWYTRSKLGEHDRVPVALLDSGIAFFHSFFFFFLNVGAKGILGIVLLIREDMNIQTCFSVNCETRIELHNDRLYHAMP